MTFRVLQNLMGVLEICFSNMILIEKSVDYILTLFRLGGGGAFRTPPPAKSL